MEPINYIDEIFLDASLDNKAKTFYLKMKGDYYRYLSEFLSSGD